MTSQTTTPSTWCLYHKDCFLHDIPVRTTAVVQKSQVTGSFHRSAQCYSRCQFVVSKNNRLFRHIVFRAYSSSKETKNDHPLYTQRKRDKRENQTLSNCQTCDVIQGSNLLPIVARRLKSLNYPPLPAWCHLWTTPDACLHNETRLCSKTEKRWGTNLAPRYNRLNLKHIHSKNCYTLITVISGAPAFRSQIICSCN